MSAISKLIKYIDTSGLSDRKVSMRATGSTDTIRNIRRGSSPRTDTLEALCRVLSLELYIGPPRNGTSMPSADAPEPDTAYKPASTSNRVAFAPFTPDMLMPARGYARCSLVGHLEKEGEYREMPAPENIRDIDPEAFYVIAKGSSMIPEGIKEGDYCLVSPNTPLTTGFRIWLKDKGGKACIKRLMEDTGRSYKLQGWQGPSHGKQTNYTDEWMKGYIAEQGVVLAVWRGKPDADKPPELIPDPKAKLVQTLPAEIVEKLGLPPGAGMEDAIKAIEDLVKFREDITSITAISTKEPE